MLSNFDGESVYSMESSSMDPSKKVYQLCLSDSRSKVLTVIKEKYLPPQDPNKRKLDFEAEEKDDFDMEEQNKRQRLQENSDD